MESSILSDPEDSKAKGMGVMKEATRATRRGHDQRMKNRARRTMRLWAGRRNAPVDPRAVGVESSTRSGVGVDFGHVCTNTVKHAHRSKTVKTPYTINRMIELEKTAGAYADQIRPLSSI